MSESTRIAEAYMQMAGEAKYRPAAPSDGMGNIQLTDEELSDGERLEAEAKNYAEAFIAEENHCRFWVGVSNYRTNRGFVYTIEAARLLCGAQPSAVVALRLLRMAAKEVKRAIDENPVGRLSSE
jgi:hypothetical protein